MNLVACTSTLQDYIQWIICKEKDEWKEMQVRNNDNNYMNYEKMGLSEPVEFHE